MAKKFGKILLATAAIGAGIAAYCYFKKKDSDLTVLHGSDDDYDDFSEDLDEEQSRNYVPLPTDNIPANTEAEDTFTPLAEQIAKSSANSEQTVEDFFDEDCSSDEEPPIQD